jgi:hypothetical protein
MGEIADYLVDRMPFPRHRRSRSPLRRMATENVTRKFCGAEGLRWQKFRGKYRLLNSDLSVHVCAPNLEGFEDLTK